MYKHHLLLSEEEIQLRIANLADDINRDYQGETLDIVCILKGAVFFLTDLMKHLRLAVRIHFMQTSSYGSHVESSETVDIRYISPMDVSGKNILIVEDILDTGITLDYLVKQMKSKDPRSLRTCVLLDKPGRRRVEIAPDYRGFEIPDHFVIGYGLDYNELGRNLRYIAVLDPSEYRSTQTEKGT